MQRMKGGYILDYPIIQDFKASFQSISLKKTDVAECLALLLLDVPVLCQDEFSCDIRWVLFSS